MIIYNPTLKYSSLSKKTDSKDNLKVSADGRTFRDLVSELNEVLGMNCGLDGALSVAIVGGKPGNLDMIMCIKQEKVTVEECLKWIVDFFKENYSVRGVNVASNTEVSEKVLRISTRKAERSGYSCGSNLYREMGFDYIDNIRFSVRELFYGGEPLFYDAALDKVRGIMADDSLIEELNRIYSDQNERRYLGNPVHYHIMAGSNEVAYEIIKILMLALKANSRVLGSRVNYIYDIEENCTRDLEFENVMKLSSGAAVALELTGTDEDHGSYASSYHSVIEYIDRLAGKYHLNTLFFLVEITNKPGFAKPCVAMLKEKLHMVNIREGVGNREKAIGYLAKIAERNKINATTDELEKALPKQSSYSASEIFTAYNKWFSDDLRMRIYPAYRDCEQLAVEAVKEDCEPYRTLQEMIGLGEVKSIIDQMLNNARIMKLRSRMGMDTYKNSFHMIFTGNPGSAKTTVARLVAEILKKEGVLESGKLVECGRADLVGQYVGWTAKQVRAKFREAKGGVLFIDEAYSLVDGSNSFGDEAINTIVQEMENHRDSVVVIFAGYPKKMEQFLANNEGLRSRIAYHINFPDYKADEMLEILKLMAFKKGYTLDSQTQEKCFGIFKAACKNEEFGNGRFARNMLEQAILKQSDRIIKSYGSRKISRKILTTLIADDFDVNVCDMYKKKTVSLGFAANL